MLLGSNVFPKTTDPEERCAILAQKGYKAGYYPEFMYSSKQTEELIRVRKAFEKYNLVIAEVGAWHNNPTHPDPEIAQRSTESLIDWLAVAEEVGANCMVNIVGSAGEGLITPENYSKDYYDFVVEKTRYIIDQVKPKRTKMSYEILPFNFLDSVDSYEQLVLDVDRKEFAVHLDPINLIIDSRLYANNARVFEYAIKRLRPYGIASMHIKDLLLQSNFPNTHLDEVPLGEGGLDIAALLRAIERWLPSDTPVMLEHLPDEEAYDKATKVVRKIASENNIVL